MTICGDVVVLNGALAADGMVAFGAELGEERLAAVRAYLIARAQQSYAAEQGQGRNGAVS